MSDLTWETVPRHTFDFRVLAEQVNESIQKGSQRVFNMKNLESIVN
jgi:hypothetical protein